MKSLFTLFVLVVCSSAVASETAQRTLTFEERVAAQKAIEQVYWNHRIWPNENHRPKPPLSAVMSNEEIRAKVEEYLKESNALAKRWQRPITSGQLQAEIDRMATSSRNPEMLRELFEALGKDPFVIAETLARQRLADRLIHERFTSDDRIHGEVKKKALSARVACQSVDCMKTMGGKYSETTWKVREEGTPARAENIFGHHVLALDKKEWTDLVAHVAGQIGGSPKSLPAVGLGGVEEASNAFIVTAVLASGNGEITTASVEWPKQPFDAWLKTQRDSISASVESQASLFTTTLSAASGCVRDTWRPTSLVAGVTDEARYYHTSVWTGSEMVVWGGHGEVGVLGTGARYDPATDSWTATSVGSNVPAPRYLHTAVWTGIEMIVWGGGDNHNFFDSGGRYNPSTNSWAATDLGANVPDNRWYHSAVWSGTEMVIWGGSGASGLDQRNTGGRYNPTTDSWAGTSLGATVPAARDSHTAVWSGTEMIVWGGYNGGNGLNTGGRYNPSTDSWAATSIGANVPAVRDSHSAVWSGSEMIVWGGYGYDNGNWVNTGGRYNPSTDSWVEISTGNNVPTARGYHTAVWTGAEMIVWGGDTNTGGRYDPSSDAWIATSTDTNVPSARRFHTGVWTGSEMVVWGGLGNTITNTGGVYCSCLNPSSSTFFRDADRDGYGAGAPVPVEFCDSVPTGYASVGGDCDDNNPNVHPGATEICNGIDDNCDGHVDEGIPGVGVACNTGLLGVCAAGTTQCSAAGSITCNQSQQPSFDTCNGLDDNCNGQVDEGNPGGGVPCDTGLPGASAGGTTKCSGGLLTCIQNLHVSVIRNNSITSLGPTTPPMASLFDATSGTLLGTTIPQNTGYAAFGEPLTTSGDGPLVLYELGDSQQSVRLSKTTNGLLAVVSFTPLNTNAFVTLARKLPDAGATVDWLTTNGLTIQNAYQSAAADGSSTFSATYSNAFCTVEYDYNQTWPFGMAPTAVLTSGNATYFLSPVVGGVRIDSSRQASVLLPAAADAVLHESCSAHANLSIAPQNASAGCIQVFSGGDACALAARDNLVDCIQNAFNNDPLPNCPLCAVEVVGCGIASAGAGPLAPGAFLVCLKAGEIATSFPTGGEAGSCLNCLADIGGGNLSSCPALLPIPCGDPISCGPGAVCKYGFCMGGANCDDDNVCTVDLCAPTGCLSEYQFSCDDGNPCTIDGCDAHTGCTHRPCSELGSTCTSTGCACPSGTTLCNTCTDTQTDNENCGNCGHQCPSGQGCSNGLCDFCHSPTVLCGGTCVDTQSDGENCGICGNQCPANSPCTNGSCTSCPPGTIICPPDGAHPPGACIDTQTDIYDCGSCGNLCSSAILGTVCSLGTCICPTGSVLVGGGLFACTSTGFLTTPHICLPSSGGACSDVDASCWQGASCVPVADPAGGASCQFAILCPFGQVLCHGADFGCADGNSNGNLHCTVPLDPQGTCPPYP